MTILDGAREVMPYAGTPEDRTSLALSAQAARVALRIAALLEANCTPASSQPTVAFLQAWAEHARQACPGAADPSSPLERIRERYELGPLARDLLLLAGLPEEHEGLAGTFRALHPQGDPRPTLGLAARLADPAGGTLQIRRLHAPRAVIGEGLVRLRGDGPLFERSIETAPALWDALHGEDAWPAGLAQVTVGAPPPGLDGWLRLPAVRRAVAALASPGARTILLGSEDEAIAVSRCAAMAADAGIRLVAARVDADDVAGARLLAAHAAARGAIPVYCVGTVRHDDAPAPSLALDLTWLRGPALVCARPGSLRTGRPAPRADRPAGPARLGRLIAAPGRRACRSCGRSRPRWRSRHPLDPALTAGRGHRPGQPAPARRADVAGGRVGSHQEPGRHQPAAGREPELARRYLGPARAAAGTGTAAAGRGRPAGPPGAGPGGLGLRRAVAPAGASGCCSPGRPAPASRWRRRPSRAAAQTDLLVVDMSRIVSKWIGETEKNLAAVFDAAERTQAVLLLDEADALFGTRTQISDAHDRYANLETAYLLQRLDRFDGLVVLTTNLRQNIDAAFLRRMDFVVEFPLPDAEHRARAVAAAPARARSAGGGRGPGHARPDVPGSRRLDPQRGSRRRVPGGAGRRPGHP